MEKYRSSVIRTKFFWILLLVPIVILDLMFWNVGLDDIMSVIFISLVWLFIAYIISVIRICIKNRGQIKMEYDIFRWRLFWWIFLMPLVIYVFVCVGVVIDEQYAFSEIFELLVGSWAISVIWFFLIFIIFSIVLYYMKHLKDKNKNKSCGTVIPKTADGKVLIISFVVIVCKIAFDLFIWNLGYFASNDEYYPSLKLYKANTFKSNGNTISVRKYVYNVEKNIKTNDNYTLVSEDVDYVKEKIKELYDNLIVNKKFDYSMITEDDYYCIIIGDNEIYDYSLYYYDVKSNKIYYFYKAHRETYEYY